MRRTIHTERLSLRPIVMEDARNMSVLGSDIDISRMTGSIPFPFPELAAELRVMIFNTAWARRKEYSYAISQNGGSFMGIISLFKRAEKGDLEIGYWLGRPHWGHGFMLEAGRGIINEAKETLGVNKLVAGVFHDNPASMKILEKLGFKPTGKSGLYFSNARMGKAESLAYEWLNPDATCT